MYVESPEDCDRSSLLQTLRIAVLECDTPMPNTKAKYGTYGGTFAAIFKSASLSPNSPRVKLEMPIFDVVEEMEYPNPDNFDAVLLTGSKHDAFADVPWINKLVEFTKNILDDTQIPIIGICFGHQIVGRALQAKVGRSDSGWESSVCDVNLTEVGRDLFGRSQLHLQQMHKDIVFEVPDGASLLGTSSVCEVQGLYIPKKLITLQGHPEFNEEIMIEILRSRYEIGAFTADMFTESMSRIGLPHDGYLVADTLIRFLLGTKQMELERQRKEEPTSQTVEVR